MKLFIYIIIFYISILRVNSQNKILLDEVYATIGNKIILRSDIQNQLADMQRQGVELPVKADCYILEQEIIKKAMAMQAEKDSLLISDEEVEGEIENRIRYFINAYGGKEELEQISGKNIYQMKEYFRMPIREGLLSRNMQKKIAENIKVTPSEIKEYFEKIPQDSLQFYETELQIGQLVIYPKAHKDVDIYTIESLKEIRDDILNKGKSFENLASLYSEDPGSKNKGGRYEINKNEKQWDPVFISTAFRLKEGEISKVVKSKFGYHIIQLVSRLGDDAVVRHILKIPQIREQDINPIVKLMDSIKTLLVEDKRKFSDIIMEYNEDESSKFTAGFIMGANQNTFVTIDELDKDIVFRLEKLKVNDYSDPFVFQDQRGRTGVKLLYLKSKTSPHKENLEDDFVKIKNKLINQKKLDALSNWIATKVPNFYLNILQKFETCGGELIKWNEDSKKNGKAF